MEKANVHYAKTHLSQLLDRVAEGDEVIIAKSGKPVARLVRYVAEPRTARPLGLARGTTWEADDCWDEDPELLRLMEEGDPVDKGAGTKGRGRAKGPKRP